MARPVKKKRICSLPVYQEFYCSNAEGDKPFIYKPVEEYETIRLLDYFDMDQKQCAKQMGVARTTVQSLYRAARKRLAACLIEGRPLRITGGKYEICQENADCCHYGQGNRVCLYRKPGGKQMKIAVTYENGQIFQHFGHSSEFKVYTIKDDQVAEAEAIDTLICGGIGAGAQNALAAAGITLYGGCSGSADAAVEALLANKLDYNPAVRCNHHGHGDDSGHTCGEHGCH